MTWILRLLGLGCLLTLSGVGCSRDSRTQADDRPEQPSVEAAALPWRAEEQHHFSFRLKSTAMVAANPPLVYEWTGDLDVFVREAGDDDLELALLLDRVDVSGMSQGGQKETHVEELTRPVIAVLTRGTLSALKFAPGTSAEAVNVQRTLAAGLQFGIPVEEKPASGKWTNRETDSTGAYQAEYEVTDDGISKRKLRYETLLVGGLRMNALEQTQPPRITASSGRWRFAGDRVSEIEHAERLSMALAGQGQVTTDTTLSLLVRDPVENSPPRWDTWLSGTTNLSSDEVYVGSAKSQQAFDEARIGNFTFETAIAQVETLTKTTPDFQATSQQEQRQQWVRQSQRAHAALSAILRRDPQRIPEVKAKIEAGSPASAKLLGALGETGSPEAQAALVQLISGERLAFENRQLALRALVRSKSPSEETVSFVSTLVTDPRLGELATFGLGSLVRQVATENPELAASASHRFEDALAAATDSKKRISVLKAIGNSGYAPLFQALQSPLNSQEPAMKAAAIEATRLMPRDLVQPVILDALQATEATVRLSALDVLQKWQPSGELLPPVRAILLHDQVAAVRAKALELVASWAVKVPETKLWLSEVAKSDPSEQLKELARRQLQ